MEQPAGSTRGPGAPLPRRRRRGLPARRPAAAGVRRRALARHDGPDRGGVLAEPVAAAAPPGRGRAPPAARRGWGRALGRDRPLPTRLRPHEPRRRPRPRGKRCDACPAERNRRTLAIRPSILTPLCRTATSQASGIPSPSASGRRYALFALPRPAAGQVGAATEPRGHRGRGHARRGRAPTASRCSRSGSSGRRRRAEGAACLHFGRYPQRQFRRATRASARGGRPWHGGTRRDRKSVV